MTTHTNAVRRQGRWLVPLVTTLVGALIGLVVAVATPDTYTATSQLFFSARGGTTLADQNSGTQLVRNQVPSFAELVTSERVLAQVGATMPGTPTSADLAKRLESDVPLDTVVLSITATGPTATEAAELANKVAAVVATESTRLGPVTADGSPALAASVTSQAQPPQRPSAPSTVVNVVIGAFLGLLAGCAAVAVALAERPLRAMRLERGA